MDSDDDRYVSIDYLVDNKIISDTDTIYTTYNTGNYALFRGLNVYIDARLEVYLESQNKQFNYINEFFALQDGVISIDDFLNKYNFAFISFLPVRKAKERSKVYITISFGLRYRKESPRIDAASEPYPNRWTHHMLISSPDEIDDELMEWIKEAAVFSAGKR